MKLSKTFQITIWTIGMIDMILGIRRYHKQGNGLVKSWWIFSWGALFSWKRWLIGVLTVIIQTCLIFGELTKKEKE